MIEVPAGAVRDEDPLATVAESYRSNGLRVSLAVRDVDHACARIERIVPDFVQLDASAAGAQSRLRDLADVARAFGVAVRIARVEAPDQHELALCAGATLVQGYQFDVPTSDLEELTARTAAGPWGRLGNSSRIDPVVGRMCLCLVTEFPNSRRA